MKTKLTLLFFLVSPILLADGGGGYGTHCHVRDMDVTYNLYYHSVDGELAVPNKKGKEDVYDITSNISIYDITTGKTSYLFPDTLKERISDFYFESHYDSLNQKMAFNHPESEYYNTMENVVGNVNLKSRKPSDKLFIITYSYVSYQYTLWTAHKTGKELKRVHEFSDDDNFYFDVKNMAIRFVTQVEKRIEIKDIKY
ncbi:MAG: hypothetical protein ACHQF2_02465 [Flavobacteriales bacterium]